MQEYAPVDDALSLLTGTEGGEGDLARGITREGVTSAMLADTAAREEHTRTPVAATTTANSSNGATSTTETNLSADAERVRASAGSLADSFNNAHNTTTTAAGAAATTEQSATATETTTAATTGTEQTATEQVVEGYDPNQPIIFKDGTRTTLSQVEHAANVLKPRYDALVTNLQKQERDLKAKQEVVDRNVEYLQAMENDPFGAVYVTARKNGSTPEQAAKAAAEAAGLALTTSPVESGPPQPGTERYFLTSYDKLGITPGTTDYDAWFTGNADATLKKRMEDERATTLKAIDDRLSKFAPASQETEEQKKSREVRAEFATSNKEMLQTLRSAILSIYKIDFNSLSGADQQKVQTALEQTFADKKMWVGTQEWMENAVLTESDIENVVLRTNIPTVLGGAARTNGAATNGSTNGAANGTVNPQLVRPNVDKSVTTISALPSGDGAVPVSPMYQGNPDNQYLEDALDLLHA